MNVADDSGLFRSLPFGACLVDREGLILAVNPALENVLGWRLSQCRGVPVSHYLEEIVEPEQALAWVVAVGKTLSAEQVTFLHVPARLPDRRSPARQVAVVGVVAPWLRPDGQPCGALLLLHDSEQMESVEGARLRFLSMIAHELNSPVNNLAFATHQLGQHVPEDASPTRRLLRIMHAEVERMQRLLGSLFSPTPAASERAADSLEAVDLEPILRQVADQAALRPPVAVYALPELPPVLANPGAVQQALESQVRLLAAYAEPGSRIALWARASGQQVVVWLHPQAAVGQGGDQPARPDLEPDACSFRLLLPVAGGQ